MRYDRQWQVQSFSNPRVSYTVSLLNGNYSCSCKAWTTRVPRRDCKHIRYVLEGSAFGMSFEMPAFTEAAVVSEEVAAPTSVFDLLRAGTPWEEVRKHHKARRAG